MNVNPADKIEGLKNLKLQKFCKIYRYYFSKSRIEEKLMHQEISKMRKELSEKQKKEEIQFNDVFHKNYPPENLTEYNNEIKIIIDKENLEKEKFEQIKKEFYEKKHDEYINKMGIEFEKGFIKLSQKFKKEKDEQDLAIKKIILNHQLKEIERNNNKKKENIKNNQNYFSQYQFYLKDENKKERDNLIKKNMSSKYFRFNARGIPYKTIIL